ncbi:response regulator transcription factor [Paraburkholderia sp. WSM4174]
MHPLPRQPAPFRADEVGEVAQRAHASVGHHASLGHDGYRNGVSTTYNARTVRTPRFARASQTCFAADRPVHPMCAGNPRHYPRNCRSWNTSCETLIRREGKFCPQNMMYSILLVDDEPEILAAWRLILESEGYEVRCASNGAEALACVVAHVPDLIVRTG